MIFNLSAKTYKYRSELDVTVAQLVVNVLVVDAI